MSQYNVQFQDGNGSLAGLRNEIINGNMSIRQRQTSITPVVSSSGGYICADRFAFNSNVTARVVNDDSLSVFGLYSVIEASRSSGTSLGINQMVELPRNLSFGTDPQGRDGPFTVGSTWTTSFYTDTLPTGFQLVFAETSERREANDVVLVDTPGSNLEVGVTVNGYTKYTYTHTIAQTADRSTVQGLKVLIQWASNVQIRTTGWQLEPGPIATPFEQIPIELELSLCQRYYQVVQMQGLIGNGNSNGTTAFFNVACSPMRISGPTTQSNIQISGGRLLTTGATSFPVTSVGFFNSQSGRIGVDRFGSTNAFDPRTCCTTTVDLDAEL